MPTVMRGISLIAALSLSTVVFAQANQEGNAPEITPPRPLRR
jgi:hypothetical protein